MKKKVLLLILATGLTVQVSSLQMYAKDRTVEYGIPKVEGVEQTMHRVLNYKHINEHSGIKKGNYKLVCYDKQMNRLLAPHSLDDSGALCCAMIKAMEHDSSFRLSDLIKRLSDCVINKQAKLSDGTFCRDFPQKNSVWLDDMFMGIPTLAWMGGSDESASFLSMGSCQRMGYANYVRGAGCVAC